MLLSEKAGKTAKNDKQGRSQIDKLGKYRYLNRKVDRLTGEVKGLRKQINAKFRILFNALEPLLAEVNGDYIVETVCRDEGDLALLDYLRSKGDLGIAPTEACSSKELKRFRFKPYNITRRIQRMNKRLWSELGKRLAESYHRRWMLTSFVHKAFGSSKEEIETEAEEEIELHDSIYG